MASRREPQTQLYVFRSAAAGLVKFGVSNYWPQRLQTLRSAHRDRSITCIKVFERSPDQVRQVERMIHDHLPRDANVPRHSAVGTSREWYREDHPEVAAVVAELLAIA